jgi:hypothetical protein
MILLWIAWVLPALSREKFTLDLPIFRPGLETLAVAIVGLTGQLGGCLSGVNGPS